MKRRTDRELRRRRHWLLGARAGGAAIYGEPSTAPSVVMRPAPGSALLYGGSITHAGMPVMMGCRVIFLASFSSRRLDLELLESS